MDAHLRAGVAVYNAGHFHAAHDAWEDRWLALERDTDDERFLHGLIQFTAAVHHCHRANWVGARGLAESAGEYLAGLPDAYRGVDVAAVRDYLAALAADPESVERKPLFALTVEGDALALDDLDLDATLVAAAVLADELDGFDEAVVEQAASYARTDVDAGGGSRFVTLVFDFVREAERRPLVYERLRQHVERRRARERDVEGLFE
ncbi:DUF309 domain-containing protein [Halobacteriaceae archaeon GCM10025711]